MLCSLSHSFLGSPDWWLQPSGRGAHVIFGCQQCNVDGCIFLTTGSSYGPFHVCQQTFAQSCFITGLQFHMISKFTIYDVSCYARNLSLLSVKGWFCLGPYFFLMENSCWFAYSCGVSSSKTVPPLLSSCVCTFPCYTLCLHFSGPLLSSQAYISPQYITTLFLSIIFCTEQLLVTLACTQIRWYCTSISRSKNKSSASGQNDVNDVTIKCSQAKLKNNLQTGQQMFSWNKPGMTQCWGLANSVENTWPVTSSGSIWCGATDYMHATTTLSECSKQCCCLTFQLQLQQCLPCWQQYGCAEQQHLGS